MSFLEQIGAAVFLATAIERLIEYLFAPIRRRWPDLDYWWIPYVVFVLGFVVGFLSNMNLYGQWVPNVLLAQILTAATIGGGSELVHQIFGQIKAVKTAYLNYGIVDVDEIEEE